MSRAITSAILAACLAGLACTVAGADDTTGTSVAGYTFGSNVAGYLDISQDVCDINAAVDAADWASALAIYTNGQNSLRDNGETRKLKGWATSGSPEETHWGMYTAYFGNDSVWLDTFIMAGLNGVAPWTLEPARKQIVKKGIQSNLLVAYMFHEVDEGEEDTENGATDPADGAPHVVDEAAAIYFGTTCPGGNIADVADKRANSFGTLTTSPEGVCTAATNVAAAKALSDMQAAAKAGDTAAYAEAAQALEKAIVTIYVQATLTYAEELQEMVAGGSLSTEVEQAEGIAFFRTIQPLVAEVSEEDAAAIYAALDNPTTDVAATVEEGFKATLDAYGITAAELGTLKATSPCTLGTTSTDSSTGSSTGSSGSGSGTSGAGRLAAASSAVAAAVVGAALLLA